MWVLFQELFYQIGYPVYFLHHLYKVTGQEKYLQTAEKLLDFALTLHQNFYTHFLNHKVIFGLGFRIDFDAGDLIFCDEVST